MPLQHDEYVWVFNLRDIQEPFTYSNTAHSIYDEMVFDAIKTAFREAHQELDTTRDLQRLLNCKPIAVNAPMGGYV